VIAAVFVQKPASQLMRGGLEEARQHGKLEQRF